MRGGGGGRAAVSQTDERTTIKKYSKSYQDHASCLIAISLVRDQILLRGWMTQQ